PFAAEQPARSSASSDCAERLTSSLRRCRQPVPARVVVDATDRPVRVTTDRRGFVGGSVVHCAGPWRTSGAWWDGGQAGGGGRGSGAGRAGGSGEAAENERARKISPPRLSSPSRPSSPSYWDRDEWDVALSDDGVYRIFRDRRTDRWFIEAIVD